MKNNTKSKEQLRAINQQLMATKQQLRTTNQQLEANIQQLITREQELKKEKNFVDKIVETASAIIVGFDKDHKIRIFNKGAECITGYTKAEVIGKDWFKIFFPKEMLNEMNKVGKDSWGILSYSYVNPILSKAGKEILVSWQTTGMYESEDVSEHLLISIGEDVTAHKQAEEELRKSEKRLSLIYNSTSDNMILMKVEDSSTFRIVSFNDEYLQTIRNVYGEFSREQLLNHTSNELKELFDWPDLIYNNTIRNYLKVIETGKPVKIVDELPTLSTTLFFETVYYPVFDSEKICTHILYTSRDITERKKAEELNKESEQRFHYVLSNSVSTIYNFNLNTATYDYVSPAVLDMYGFSPEEMISGGLKETITRFHPEDLKKVENHLDKLLSKKIEDFSPTIEYRFYHPKLGYRWIILKCCPIISALESYL